MGKRQFSALPHVRLSDLANDVIRLLQSLVKKGEETEY